MINEIKRRLASGEIVELECIDERGFLSNSSAINSLVLSSNKRLIVDSINEDGDVELVGGDEYNFILSWELKSFKIVSYQKREEVFYINNFCDVYNVKVGDLFNGKTLTEEDIDVILNTLFFILKGAKIIKKFEEKEDD